MKIYIVYNKWQMDTETWAIYFELAFSDKKKAIKYLEKLKKSADENDNFLVEEVDFEK